MHHWCAEGGRRRGFGKVAQWGNWKLVTTFRRVFSTNMPSRHPRGTLYTPLLHIFYHCFFFLTLWTSENYQHRKIFSKRSLRRQNCFQQNQRIVDRNQHTSSLSVVDTPHFAPLSFTPFPALGDTVTWQQCSFSSCWRRDRYCGHIKNLRRTTAFSLKPSGHL